MIKKTFSKKIKAKAVDKINSGISVKDVSIIIGTTPASVRAWIRQANNGNHIKSESEIEKIDSFQKENGRLMGENYVLLKLLLDRTTDSYTVGKMAQYMKDNEKKLINENP